MQIAGCKVLQAQGDADTMIVRTPIEEDKKGLQVTAVIGNDTDLLVLLIAHAPADNKLKMVTHKKGSQKVIENYISDIQRDIGDMKDVLLAVYAFTGYDTVSAIYNKGKIGPFKKVQSNKDLRTMLLTFNDPNADPNVVANAGKQFFLSIFGFCKNEDLYSARHWLLENDR